MKLKCGRIAEMGFKCFGEINEFACLTNYYDRDIRHFLITTCEQDKQCREEYERFKEEMFENFTNINYFTILNEYDSEDNNYTLYTIYDIHEQEIFYVMFYLLI